MGIFDPPKSDLYGEIPHSTQPGFQSVDPTTGVQGVDNTANGADYQWGASGGNDAATMATARGAQWTNKATNWDTGTRNGQLALAGQLSQDQVSSAAAMGQAQQDQAIRQAQLARAHGAGAIQSQQGIQGQQMQAIQGAANQRAQDSATAQGMYGQVLGQGRDVDQKEVGFDAQQNAQMNLYYQQLANKMRTQQMGANINREDQNINNWQNFYKFDQAQQGLQNQQQQADQAHQDKIVGAVGKAVGSGSQGAGSM